MTLITIALIIAEAAYAGAPANDRPSQGNARDVTQPAGAQVGICVRTLSGKVLKEVNSGQNFIPASNLKLVTTGTALKKLGADFRFETAVAYSGSVDEDGVLRGDLYIIGGGDPTLGSSAALAVPKDSLFAKWGRAVRGAGIRSVAGSVVADSRKMPAEVNGSWMYEDMGTYYGATCSALMFNENCLDITVAPGAEVGDDVRIFKGTAENGDKIRGTDSREKQSLPNRPWMTIMNSCTTGAEGSGDKSCMLVTELAPVGQLVGTYAVDRKAKSVSYNDPFADFSCAYEFAEFLITNGIPCASVTSTSSCHPTATFDKTTSQGKADKSARGIGQQDSPAKPVFGFEIFDTSGSLSYSKHFTSQDSLTFITTTPSPRLYEIVKETLRVSNNLYAETLLRAQAPAGSTDDAIVSESRTLENMGVSTSRTRLDDGSGLSRKNSVSPEFLVNFLTAMSRQSCFRTYLHALNTPGPDERLFSTYAPELRRRIRLKSGSMGGVLCYSGYILPASNAMSAEGTSKETSAGETIAFSIMINDSIQSSSRLRGYIESVLSEFLR